jgi:hypothetical protein
MFVAENVNSKPEKQLVQSFSDNILRERLKRNIVDGVASVARFVDTLVSQGLFVTVKLALSFIQVLLGTLPRFYLHTDTSSSPSFLFSVDLNPMQYVPIMSECTSSGSLDRPFAHILMILFLPAMFVVMLFVVRWLVMYLIQRNAPSQLPSNASKVDRAIFDVTLQAIVWFCFFAFPLLASG